MKITMLYSNTVNDILNDTGYTWEHVSLIKDNDNRVKYGENNQYSCSLADMFYSTHMGGLNQQSDNYQKLLTAFLEALEETKKRRGQNLH